MMFEQKKGGGFCTLNYTLLKLQIPFLLPFKWMFLILFDYLSRLKKRSIKPYFQIVFISIVFN